MDCYRRFCMDSGQPSQPQHALRRLGGIESFLSGQKYPILIHRLGSIDADSTQLDVESAPKHLSFTLCFSAPNPMRFMVERIVKALTTAVARIANFYRLDGVCPRLAVALFIGGRFMVICPGEPNVCVMANTRTVGWWFDGL